jgi:hypothetical protein
MFRAQYDGTPAALSSAPLVMHKLADQFIGNFPGRHALNVKGSNGVV